MMRSVRSDVVVVDPQALDSLARVVQVREPIEVEAVFAGFSFVAFGDGSAEQVIDAARTAQ